MRLLNITLTVFIFFAVSKADLNSYIVRTNDTCYDIIHRYHIYNETFYENNPEIDCDKLIPGDIVNIFNNNTLIISKKDLNDIKKSC